MLEFEFIQIAVGCKDRFSSNPSLEDWTRLLHFAQKQSLVGFLFCGIEKLPKEQLPPRDLLLKWYSLAEFIKRANDKLNIRCKELDANLKEGGFRGCVLKGQGAALLYPKPEYRQCGDIDMWVGTSDGSKASISSIVSYAEQKSVSVTHIDIKHADMHFFNDAQVEIHFKPSYSYNFIYDRRLDIWFRLVSKEQFENYDAKVGFAYPTVGFNLVYSLLHIYRHLFSEGIGLRQMLDYYYILMNSTLDNRKQAYRTMCSFGMKDFASAAMYVLQEVFGLHDDYLLCEPSEKSGKFILNEILIAGNFGQYDNRTKKINKEKRLERGLVQLARNFRFVKYYPQEVLASPIWKCWHYGWRKMHGYL
jgi:hypothetical protein